MILSRGNRPLTSTTTNVESKQFPEVLYCQYFTHSVSTRTALQRLSQPIPILREVQVKRDIKQTVLGVLQVTLTRFCRTQGFSFSKTNVKRDIGIDLIPGLSSVKVR